MMNVFVKPNEQNRACSRYAMARKGRMKSNVFVKPNEQNRACSRYVMARKGRMKSNVRNIWSYAALLMVFVALLPAVVGCNASDDADVTAETPSAPQHLNVRFRVLMHENGKKTINKDEKDHEDYVEKVVLLGRGKARSVNATGEHGGTATWIVPIGQVNNNAETRYFVANCADADEPTFTSATSLAGITLNTDKYLRRYGALGAKAAMLMTATVEQGVFPAADATGTRTLNKNVTFKRVFARFSYQTYPLPPGYVITKVTVERIPNQFMLNGDKPSSVGHLNSLVLWQGFENEFAKWQRSPWQSQYTPHPDMYLSGHFYLPPCKLDNSTDFFGTNQRGGMPVMRFVFTDNQNRTFVRLYRLGNSNTKTGKGNIEVNKHYDVRINLLGPYQERADNDEDLKPFDEDKHKVKAAFVN